MCFERHNFVSKCGSPKFSEIEQFLNKPACRDRMEQSFNKPACRDGMLLHHHLIKSLLELRASLALCLLHVPPFINSVACDLQGSINFLTRTNSVYTVSPQRRLVSFITGLIRAIGTKQFRHVEDAGIICKCNCFWE